MLDEGSGRFTIGPLTEVIAQHHAWADVRDRLEPGPRAALVAHERALRGDHIDAADVVGLPDVLEVPYALAEWEPTYRLADYHDVERRVPVARCSRSVRVHRTAWCRRDGRTRSRRRPVHDAVRQLVEPWTVSSNGRCDVVAVAGGMPDALAALGLRRARVAALTTPEALAWLGWAGASGGAFGRRRGAALGRFGAWWVLTALANLIDDWPIDAAELGDVAGSLRWWWFDAHEPATGWQLQLAVEDPAESLAWAINARDAV